MVCHTPERKRNKQTNLFFRIQSSFLNCALAKIASESHWLACDTARVITKNVNLSQCCLCLGPFNFSLLESTVPCMAWTFWSLAPLQGHVCTVPFFLRAFAHTVHWGWRSSHLTFKLTPNFSCTSQISRISLIALSSLPIISFLNPSVLAFPSLCFYHYF